MDLSAVFYQPKRNEPGAQRFHLQHVEPCSEPIATPAERFQVVNPRTAFVPATRMRNSLDLRVSHSFQRKVLDSFF